MIAVILLLGSTLEIKGRTLTDHVKTQYAQVKRTPTFQGLSKILKEEWSRVSEKADEELLPTEREKLQNFLEELGSSN